MMHCKSLLILVLCAFGMHARADTINFDDIDATSGDVILTTYQGYNWANFSAYTTAPGFPGFNNGIVSPPNAAYSSGLGQISSSTAFDFTTVHLGSGYYDGLSVTVQGLLGGILYDSQTVVVDTEGAQSFTFNFAGIDTLQFSASTTSATTDPYGCGAVGCTYFTLDDISLTPSQSSPGNPVPSPSPVPEPSTVSLLALGLLSVAFLRTWSNSRRTA